MKNKGDKKHEVVVQHGTITYHDEHGHPITLTYIADEHGFQPQGAHLPTPPPVPEDLQKKSLNDFEQREVSDHRHQQHQYHHQEEQQPQHYQDEEQHDQQYERY